MEQAERKRRGVTGRMRTSPKLSGGLAEPIPGGYSRAAARQPWQKARNFDATQTRGQVLLCPRSVHGFERLHKLLGLPFPLVKMGVKSVPFSTAFVRSTSESVYYAQGPTQSGSCFHYYYLLLCSTRGLGGHATEMENRRRTGVCWVGMGGVCPESVGHEDVRRLGKGPQGLAYLGPDLPRSLDRLLPLPWL